MGIEESFQPACRQRQVAVAVLSALISDILSTLTLRFTIFVISALGEITKSLN